MLNHKTIFKQKSKIFITILCIFGLLFSYSCKCRNQISDPNEIPPIDNETPPPQIQGTFSMSAATDNVVASIVKSSTTSINDIKISFVSANNYDYTMEYTVDDASETVAENKIDKTNFQLANNVLTASESLLNKIKNLNTDNGPAEKTITIKFTFKAKDTTLKNNTQTLSVEVKLTRSQSLDDDKVLEELKEIGVVDSKFDFNAATVNNKVFSVSEDAPVNEKVTTAGFISALNKRIEDRKDMDKLQKLNRLDTIDKVEVSADKKTATFYFKLILDDKYDPIYNEEANPLKIEVKIETGKGTWKDTGTTPTPES